MENFFYSVPTKVNFGKGAIAQLPSYVKEFGSRVLLVYGGGSIKRTGLYDEAMKLFHENDIVCMELAGVEPNPRLSTVRRGIKLCRDSAVDVIVPIGGGSSIDCAKGIAAGALYDGDVWELVNDSSLIKGTLPIIAISTMSATGSEMDPFSVITNEATKEKRDLYHQSLYPEYAILDPEYTYSLPPHQTAAGVADIMSHIFEVYFAPGTNTFMQDRMMEALLKTLVTYGPIAYREPDSYDARANIMWASEWAINGFIACGRSGPWAAHAIEHPLSAFYDITHGQGLAVITPVLMKYILNDESLERFVSLGLNVFNIDKKLPEMEIAKKAIDALKTFFRKMAMPDSFKKLGISDDSQFEAMAECAVREGIDECLVPLSKEDVVNIYRGCMQPENANDF